MENPRVHVDRPDSNGALVISHLSPSSDGRMLGPSTSSLISEKQLNSGPILTENGLSRPDQPSLAIPRYWCGSVHAVHGASEPRDSSHSRTSQPRCCGRYATTSATRNNCFREHLVLLGALVLPLM